MHPRSLPPRASPALAALSLLACTRDAPPTVAPAVAVEPDAAAPSPSRAPPAAQPVADAGTTTTAPASCKASLPPADLVRDNVAATAMSGLAEIVASTKTGLDGGTPAPRTGYVSFRYEVRVLRWFTGAGPERIVLSQGAEAESTPQPPGRLLFFSACAAADGSAYEPDVGYFFAVDAVCRADVEALAEPAAKGLGAKRRLRACERPKGR
jgi:hypothetical protein